jgi:hypothetical protein
MYNLKFNQMKTIKKISILFIALVTISCSSEDDVKNPADNPEFNATLNGGPFTDYQATLGYAYAEKGISGNTLIINVTDSNNNTIRLFLNSTGGLGNGVTKTIGTMDSDGFITTVTIRDQASQITYSSKSGSITILENKENPADDQYRVVSGNFNVITASGATDVTISGTFKNIEF